MGPKTVLALVTLLLFRFPNPMETSPEEDAQPSVEDMEQAAPEPNDSGWGFLLKAAMQQGPFWAVAELLLLPLGLWLRRKRAAMRQRAAARRAAAEARRRRREMELREMERRRRIEQRKLRMKRAIRDLKEMWMTVKMIKNQMARML